MERTIGPPKEIKKVNDYVWELPATFKKGMQVPARIYASKKLLDQMDEGVFNQVTNVACMPGIQKYAVCHADGHWGYGMPIGGVAAFDINKGVISPGSVGFDINCGMKLIKTNLTLKDLKPKIKELTNLLFKTVPAGVGCKGFVNLNNKKFDEVITSGVKWCVENDYGWEQDLERTEDYGCLRHADSSKVSEKARKRGINQLGTLGSGNHYLEIQSASANNIFEKGIARKIGITESDQVVVMLHCGSRGFGHQVATDYLKIFNEAMKKHKITLPDKELACAPFQSKEGQDYYKAMACAANMAFANRQVILHRVREAFSKIFNQSAEDLGMELIVDNTHNLAREQILRTEEGKKKYLVHLKGATRSLGPGHPDLSKFHKEIGSGICLGGSMQTGSYFLTGTKKAEEETFGTTAHGSGRTMSRTKAKKLVRGEKLQKDMEKGGIYVKSVSMSGLAEEAGMAYKEIDDVVDAINRAGISKPIVKLIPHANVKG